METANYIINQPLPVTQDFKSLKAEGLAYIQEIAGNEWTNLNPSDPGVTILDQLCFAFTELGYCNDFPIKDILTNSKGKLELKDQFYLPEEILTTSPITINDYIKYILDSFKEIENVIICPQTTNCNFIKGVYAVYLSIPPSISDANELLKISRSVFYRLNKRRNIGEVFLMPLPLQPVIQLLQGQLEINDIRDANKILTQAQTKIRNYIFPKTSQFSYDQLIAKGEYTDEILNGPALQYGWVASNTLGTKLNSVLKRDLIQLIRSIEGVKSISSVVFNDMTSNNDQLITIDISGLTITSKASSNIITKTSATLLAMSYTDLEKNSSFGASENLHPKVPIGKFRDINNYYSIQNTFPEIFAVGANSINSNATNFQIAQSRQLKGYLTLFDQVLANQFSQLANIHQLFSFKNSMCGNPSDQAEYYAVKSLYEKEHPEYPVPYITFSPTYFYQSLYKIPNIRPLLRDNDIFMFSTELTTRKELEQKSWENYIQDPYNQYIRGLMSFMGDEDTNLTRRDALLDHILARHGESPLLINAIINGSEYAGGGLKDQVIFKSLFLQNLGTLSYFRQKGYNYLGAKKIAGLIDVLPNNIEEYIHQKFAKESILFAEYSKKNRQQQNFYDNTIDSIFNSRKIDYLEKIRKIDYINYSALELKLNLLFGLRTQYMNTILEQVELINNSTCETCENKSCSSCADAIAKIKIALWMMQERKGFLFIENCLLQPASFEIIISPTDVSGSYYKIDQPFSYTQAMEVYFMLRSVPEIKFTEKIITGKTLPLLTDIIIGDVTSFPLIKTTPPSESQHWIASANKITPFNFIFNINESNSEPLPIKDTIELVFPDFIPVFTTPAFKERLDLFFNNTLPIELSFTFRLANQEQLTNMIPAYVEWHNSMVYNNFNPKHATTLASSAAILIELINATKIIENV